MARRSPVTAVQSTTLTGGLRVVTEAVPGVRSAAFGIWVGVGSRDEHAHEAGASHFLEHLLFKGTERRDALEIAAVMDAVGGDLNAFTGKEYTCFYARTLDVDLRLAVDVVSDLVTSALVSQRDVENERGVILEEISMHDDDPGDVVHDAVGRVGDAVEGGGAGAVFGIGDFAGADEVDAEGEAGIGVGLVCEGDGFADLVFDGGDAAGGGFGGGGVDDEDVEDAGGSGELAWGEGHSRRKEAGSTSVISAWLTVPEMSKMRPAPVAR